MTANILAQLRAESLQLSLWHYEYVRCINIDIEWNIC